MKYLYLILDIFTIAVPLGYSIIEKKFNFSKQIKPAFYSIFIVGIFFLIWDAVFTKIGIWGFNPKYFIGPSILGMPIEEWLFFICIPYACLFSHEALKYYTKNWGIPIIISKFLTLFLIAITLTIAFFYTERTYTFYNYSIVALVLLSGHIYMPQELAKFYPSFFILLLPFFIVNGILTGSFIPEEVVWYNDLENLGIRIGTIPVEDITYAFSMLFSSVMIFNKIKNKWTKQEMQL